MRPVEIIINSGERFGYLTTVQIEKRGIGREKRNYWLCNCDCGGIVYARGDQLKSGHTRSCGCMMGATLPPGIAAQNALYKKYKDRAKEKKISFALSKTEFLELTNKDCFYCGKEPSQTAKNYPTCNSTYIYNGIDRIDSSTGYTITNCVPCCKRCNQAKNDMPQNDFIELCRRVAKMFSITNDIEIRR